MNIQPLVHPGTRPAERRPGVLLAGNFLSGSGRSPQLSELVAEALRDRGWSIVTTSTQPNRQARVGDMLATAWRRRDDYRVAHVDVFSGPSFRWAEAVCVLLDRLKKPYVLTLRGGALPAFAEQSPKRVRHLLRGAAVVTAPSRYLVEQMAPYRPDLLLLPNPVDVAHAAGWKREAPRPRLVWLRAFHSIYNPTLGPRVVARLLPSTPEVLLTMIGPDKGDGAYEETRRVAADLGVLDRLAFPGRVDKAQVPRWLGEHDIFVNTTNVDNAPVSVIEAMASGLCVVSTNVGGIPYLLEDEVDALLVPPDDPDQMAAAVRRILVEDGLASTLSTNALAKAQTFDWAVVLPRWERLFAGLAERERFRSSDTAGRRRR